MKPLWETAPHWASYLAMDENGEWYWFEHEPTMADGNVWYSDGRLSGASVPPPPDVDWGGTMERRP